MSEAMAVYLRFKAVFGGATSSYLRRISAERVDAAAASQDESSQPFGPRREPVSLASAFGAVGRNLGWQTPLAQAELIEAWMQIAGAETAAHSTPLHVDERILVVQCDSTAWATQLRRMRSHILGEIASRFPRAEVDDIRFLNPGAPSWKRGRRSVPGRGPRDTYG